MIERKRMLALLLAALLTCGMVTGCKKDTVDEVQGEVVEKPTVLTHVYKGEDIDLPEEYSISSYLGTQDGNMVFQASYFKELVVTDDDYQYENWPALCYLPVDGGEPTFQRIEGHDWINTMVLIDGGYMILDSQWDELTNNSTYYLEITKDGETTTVDDLSRFFTADEDGWFYVDKIVQDGDGYTYLTSDQDIAILNPDYTLYGKVTLDCWVSNVDVNAEGTVYVQYYSYTEGKYGGYKFAPIDRENKKLGDPISLPDTIDADEYFFGEGYTLYYTNDIGIYGYNEGDPEGTLLMHFQNSDITGDLDMVKVIDRDSFLLEYYDRLDWHRQMGIFTKSDDIDLSQITVLELATANSYTGELASYVVKFNREHTDTRIVVTNYDQYSTDEDYNAGYAKLASDIVNGLYKPDMIFGNYSGDDYYTVIDRDLFLDMTPYLEKDTKLNISNLFNCVTNTYQKDGKIFGLPTTLRVRTIIANKEMVGDRSGWTVDELIDYIQLLPEGVSYMSGMTQDTSQSLLGDDGYGIFIDQENGTCSFDSDTFIHFLEYIKTLPKELPDDYYDTYYDDQYGATKRGEVVATEMWYSGINDFIQEKVYFGEDNIAYVGNPTKDGIGGVTLSSGSLYTILADSENADACWEFIRDTILSVNDVENDMYSDGLPMLRSSVDTLKEYYEGTTFVVHYDGGMSWGTGYDPDEDELDNGEMYRLTDADWAHIEDFLDSVGAPLTSTSLPEEVSSIISEEISSFLGGTKSATDCANMIQNRVSLYLAENS